MTSLIDPRCDVPSYLMNSEEIAVNCGKTNGIIIGVILTVITLCTTVILYFKKDDNDQHNKQIKNKNPFIYFGIASSRAIASAINKINRSF